MRLRAHTKEIGRECSPWPFAKGDLTPRQEVPSIPAMLLKSGLVLIQFWCAAFVLGAATGDKIIFDMDAIRHQPGEVTVKDQGKVPVGKVELVDGQFGKAVRFSFSGGVGAGFMTAPIAADSNWNRAEGFSFYVKGDGSTHWAGLELIDRSDYSLRYGYCFSIDSTEWKKIVVPWRDLIPELAGPLVDPMRGYAPAGFGNFWFGKWFYWHDYPAHSFAIDQIILEDHIDPSEQAFGGMRSTGLARFREKLKAGRAVTIVTMGDSLSDKRHWANQQTVWSEELIRQMQQAFGASVKLVNPAIGGTTLSQNLILMPRWLYDAPQPDLVTVWFGGNDWDSGVRGPRFKEYLTLGVERIWRMTGGSADVALLTACPAFKRWETMKELEQAAREVAQEKHVGLVDVAGAFRAAGTAEQALEQGYWAGDNVHLGTNGHKLAADIVLKAIQGQQ